jgi:hypothetical protein
MTSEPLITDADVRTVASIHEALQAVKTVVLV